MPLPKDVKSWLERLAWRMTPTKEMVNMDRKLVYGGILEALEWAYELGFQHGDEGGTPAQLYLPIEDLLKK